MVSDGTVLLVSTLVTFVTVISSFQLIAPLFPDFDFLQHLARATNIMDQQTLLAFGVGLVLSVLVLVFLNSGGSSRPVLDPKEWQSFKLTEKTKLSPNTALYRFALPKQTDILGLPIGQHISVQANIGGKNVMRSYTPTSSDDDKGFFELLIKTYPQGNISKYVDELKVGESIQVKGPKGQMRYTPGLAKRIGMIAGGTGITPMLQVIRAIMKNPADKTKVDLIYANVKEDDILVRKELEQLAKEHPEQFSCYFFLNEAPDNWKGGVGFVTKESIQEKLPAPSDDIKILMCGPPPMLNAMKKHLEELNYEKPATISKMEHQVFCF